MVVSYVLNLGAKLVGKKWRTSLIWYLKDGPLRFSQIKKLMPSISVKVLTEVLKDLEQNGLITRTQYNTIPVKVTYEISPNAHDFVDATVNATIKTAEYVVKNHIKHGLTKELLAELECWIEINNPVQRVTKK